jgi:hypothetical protein
MTKRITGPARVGALVSAPLLIAVLASGCGSSKGASAIGSTGGTTPTGQQTDTALAQNTTMPATTPASSGGSTGGSTAGSGAAILSGKQLQAVLAATPLPSGFSVESGSGDASTSSEDPGDPQLPSDDCAQLTDETASNFTDDFRSTYATETLSNSSSGATIDIALADFQPGYAAKQIAEVQQFATRCATYTGQGDNNASVTVHASVSTSPQVGDQSADVHVVPVGHYDNNEILVVRVGDRMIALGQSGDPSQFVSLTSVAQSLVAKIAG